MVQHYELMVAFPGTMNEATLAEAKQQVIDTITTKGTITVQCDLPRRRLAYPIGKETFGFYSVIQFDLDTAELLQVSTSLKLNTNVLRYLLVKADPQTVEQIQVGLLVTTPEVVVPVVEIPVQSPVQSEVVLHTPAPAEVVTESTVQPVEKKAVPVSMEELDKKLDAILEDTDIEMKL